MSRAPRHSSLIPLVQAFLILGLALPLIAQQTAPIANSTPADTLQQAREQLALGNASEAVLLFQDALSSPYPPVLSAEDALSYATALSATGDLAGAQQQITDALARNPDSAPLNDALGALLAQEGHLNQALPLFQRACSIDPHFARAQYHLGVALLTLNDPTNAIAPLELAATITPDDFDVQLQFGRALSALHEDADALPHLHRADELRTPATSPQAIYALGLALQASGDPKTALPLFESALTDPSVVNSSALINDALAHVETGDAKGSLPLYARALALGPDSATLREDFGVAYLQQADINHAIEQFRAGVALEPNNAHLHYDLGLALKLKDDLTDAVPEFVRSAELDPTLPDPAYTLGIIYMQQGRFSEAATQLKRATTLEPDNGDAWALLGSVLKASGDPSGATGALKRAIALQPDQPSLHIQLAALEYQAGQKEAAAADRKIAANLSRAAINRQRANFALRSARALLDENKVPEAIEQLNTAIQADPTLGEPHDLLAEAYTREGKSADAALERQHAIELEHQQTTTAAHP